MTKETTVQVCKLHLRQKLGISIQSSFAFLMWKLHYQKILQFPPGILVQHSVASLYILKDFSVTAGGNLYSVFYFRKFFFLPTCTNLIYFFWLQISFFLLFLSQ